MEDLLTKKRCLPCEGGTKPLTKAEAEALRAQTPGWTLTDDASGISREFKFADFMQAMEFVDRVADIAQIEDHHPDIHVFYNKVRLDLSTHSIRGLSENDFIVAAKVNELPAA